MPAQSYTYDPTQVKSRGKDRMRFELGDVMVDGGPDTAALTDAEIEAALEVYPDAWKRAKLFLLESLCRRFAYETDTKTGPLSFNFLERAKLWRKDYEALKAEVESGSVLPDSELDDYRKPPYFFTGMQENPHADYPGGVFR